jgi:formylglycine-generating enzyme required for sulfatase activity
MLIADLSQDASFLNELQRITSNPNYWDTSLKILKPDVNFESRFSRRKIVQWAGNPEVVALLRLGCLEIGEALDEESKSKYSFEKLNVSKLLRVSPAVVRAKTQAISEELMEPPVQGIKENLDTIISEKNAVELIRIPGGEFVMGSDVDDREKPSHSVRVSAFYLSRYPVTNEEYGRYLEANPNEKKPEYWGNRQYNQPRQPVVGVSWDEAQKYCEWAGLRLPSEAEWEYACRAGTTTRYWSGDTDADLTRVGWYGGNSDKRLHSVGEKEPNPFRLYDMHGNVWEWVEDDWHDSYDGAPTDGSAWVDKERAEARVCRGGSFNSPAERCRSALRSNDLPGRRFNDLGFRPARSIP